MKSKRRSRRKRSSNPAGGTYLGGFFIAPMLTGFANRVAGAINPRRSIQNAAITGILLNGAAIYLTSSKGLTDYYGENTLTGARWGCGLSIAANLIMMGAAAALKPELDAIQAQQARQQLDREGDQRQEEMKQLAKEVGVINGFRYAFNRPMMGGYHLSPNPSHMSGQRYLAAP